MKILKASILKIIFIITILLIVTTNCKTANQSKNQDCPKITFDTDTTTVKFEGIITNVKNDCWADGFCSIEIDHKWWVIIIDGGLKDPEVKPEIRGEYIGISFSQNNESIGKKVKVYAKIKSKNRLTLEGSKEYYVKVIE